MCAENAALPDGGCGMTQFTEAFQWVICRWRILQSNAELEREMRQMPDCEIFVEETYELLWQWASLIGLKAALSLNFLDLLTARRMPDDGVLYTADQGRIKIQNAFIYRQVEGVYRQELLFTHASGVLSTRKTQKTTTNRTRRTNKWLLGGRVRDAFLSARQDIPIVSLIGHSRDIKRTTAQFQSRTSLSAKRLDLAAPKPL